MTLTTIDKSGERVQRMFGEIAPHYDRMNHLLSLNIDRYWRWFTVKTLKPKPGEPILDVCTGTGDLALAFQRATGGKSDIVAADFCREMLEIGRRKQQRQRYRYRSDHRYPHGIFESCLGPDRRAKQFLWRYVECPDIYG